MLYEVITDQPIGSRGDLVVKLAAQVVDVGGGAIVDVECQGHGTHVQVLERPHVVQTIGELDENNPDVIDHRQDHLANRITSYNVCYTKLLRTSRGIWRSR